METETEHIPNPLPLTDEMVTFIRISLTLLEAELLITIQMPSVTIDRPTVITPTVVWVSGGTAGLTLSNRSHERLIIDNSVVCHVIDRDVIISRGYRWN